MFLSLFCSFLCVTVVQEGHTGGLLLSRGSLLFLGVTRGFSQRITIVRGFAVV